MPGAEGLDGGSPEIRPLADQAPVSQGYDPDTESHEARVDEVMHRSGMRLTRAEAEEYVADVDGYVNRVEQHLTELLREERGEDVEG